ncbi:MAG: hypothetical protein NC182_05810 [Prevotella sp.]|nr:hypothetical protein [Staphylococcus sp.]MCM1350700.1 hypothetical protein [Prevotella sp.]
MKKTILVIICIVSILFLVSPTICYFLDLIYTFEEVFAILPFMILGIIGTVFSLKKLFE